MISEKQLHKQICDYIKLQYPKVLFNTDMSGIKLTIGQATQAKKLRSGNGFPDIIIYEPKYYSDSIGNSDVSLALFLEVKKESPYKKDGTLKKDIHLMEQFNIMVKLEAKGYECGFVWSFDMAKDIIDSYLSK